MVMTPFSVLDRTHPARMYVCIYIDIYIYIDIFAGAFQDAGLGPVVGTGMGPVLTESLKVCMQCFVNELVLAVFRRIPANCREVVLGQCFQNRSLMKSRTDFLQFVVQKWDVIIFGRSCPKIAQDFFLGTRQLCCFHASRPLAQFGGMKTVFSEVSKSNGVATSILGPQAVSGRCAKCLQTPCL